MSGAKTGADVEQWDDDDRVWVEPSLAQPDGAGDVLSAEQVAQWRSDGALVVHGIWPSELIDSCQGQLSQMLPQPPPELISIAELLAWASSPESSKPLGARGFQMDGHGRMRWAARWLFAPYRLGAAVNAWAWTRRLPASAEVAPGLRLGRIPTRDEWLAAGQPRLVSLCAELQLPRVDGARPIYATLLPP